MKELGYPGSQARIWRTGYLAPGSSIEAGSVISISAVALRLSFLSRPHFHQRAVQARHSGTCAIKIGDGIV